MGKNRKTFLYVLQFGKRPENKEKVLARIYRVKQNKPEFIGFTEYLKGRYEKHALRVAEYLKNKGHVCKHYEAGKDFGLEAV